ncbi:MAG: CBS domain-containing protein [Hominenteromicrobium sp.]
MRSDEFIDLYKQLEDALEEKFSGAKRRYSSVIFEYINHYESAPVRESLNLCREIRNLMTHNANLGGEPIVEPSEPVVESLRQTLEYVRRPPLALDFATTGSRIFCAGLSERVLSLMAAMEKNGFSHIPIVEKKVFVGVFSVSTIFSCVLQNPQLRITPETTLRELGEMLPVDRHIENYAFVDRETTSIQARRMFEKIRGKNKRLSVIFITETGSREEPLLGMLTPWDVMKDD